MRRERTTVALRYIDDIGRRLHKAIAAQIRKLDYTRPITAAEDKTPDRFTIYDSCDVVGINYNLGIQIIFGRDVIHGHHTGCPLPLAMAISFNDELVKTAYRDVAR